MQESTRSLRTPSRLRINVTAARHSKQGTPDADLPTRLGPEARRRNRLTNRRPPRGHPSMPRATALSPKNRATILREAEVSMVDIIERRGKEAFLDSLFVMEEGMRHYFSKAMQAKTNNMKPEIVDNYMQKAIDVAEKVAPYRHARLSAVKLAGDPNNSAPFKDDASVDELREEIMQFGFGGCNRPEGFASARWWNSESAASGVDQSGCQRGVII